jgi:hypothetical protein
MPTFGPFEGIAMIRQALTPVLALSVLTFASGAFADDTQTTQVTTTQTTTPLAPPPASTTTVTQAAVDVPPPVVVTSQPTTESGGSTTTTWVNRPLLVTGALLFGGTYAASAAVAGESNRPSDNPNLYYPIVGPWLDLAQRDCTATRPCVGETGNKTLLVLDGVTQGIGALAIVTSLFVPEKKSRHWFIIGNEKVHAEPVSVGSGYGLAAQGKF